MSSNPNNIVYPKAKEYFMSGAIALTGGAYSSVATANQAIISVALISSSYPINNFATQSFYHDAVNPVGHLISTQMVEILLLNGTDPAYSNCKIILLKLFIIESSK